MKINKFKLIKCLELVKPGLSSKDLIEFTDAFSFTTDYIITFNDEICIRTPFESDIKGTVPAEKFSQVVAKLAPAKNDEFHIKQTDNELLIKGKRTKSGITFNPEGALPLEEIGKLPKKWTKIPDNFIDGIKLSVFCTSNDASMPVITCLNISGDTIQATDRYRAFKYQLSKKIKTPFLVPANCASIITKYPVTKYAIDKSWAHFKTSEGIIISSRIYKEEFPDISKFYDQEGDNISFPKNTLQSLEKAGVFCDGESVADHLVTVIMGKKKTLFKSKSTAGWFEEIIPHKNKNISDELSFEINIHFLTDILKTAKGCKYNESLISFESDQWEHIITIIQGD